MVHELIISDIAHKNLVKMLDNTTIRGTKVCKITQVNTVDGFKTLRHVVIESTEITIQKMFEHLLNEIYL